MNEWQVEGMKFRALLIKWIVIGCMLILATIVAVMAVMPRYSVWSQEMAGRAELARAESNRKIAVREAEAKKDAATMLADAEIARARGVAEANKIIGEGLKGHEEYLRYLWIMSLEHSALRGNTIVYIPTEANLPILEASRKTVP